MTRALSGLITMWLMLLWGHVAAEARGQAPATQCSVRHDGAQVIAQFSSEDGHKNRRLSFDLVTTGGPPESRTSAVTVSLKNRLVFRLDSSLTDVGAKHVHFTAGFGAKIATRSGAKGKLETACASALTALLDDGNRHALVFRDAERATR